MKVSKYGCCPQCGNSHRCKVCRHAAYERRKASGKTYRPMKQTKAPEGTSHFWINNQGYRVGRIVRNGKWCYTRAHRVVVENALGRLLEKGELVHHRNKDRTDNRLENLEPMTWAKHNRIHISPKFIASGLRNLELGRELIRKNGPWNKGNVTLGEFICSFCGKSFAREARIVNQSRKRGCRIVCSISCRSLLTKQTQNQNI